MTGADTVDEASKGSPPGIVLLSEGLGPLVPERGSFGELMPCRMCGGKPYAYDMRGTDTHELCTVECGSCDHDVQAGTPEAAAANWHAARA